jgi:ATP-dependent RNA helicase RhlE
VINFEIPNIPETYVHRIGRTGRAGNSGIAWSLVDREELPFLKDIQKLIRQDIPVDATHPYQPGAVLPQEAPEPPRPPREPRGPGKGKGGNGGGNNGGNRSKSASGGSSNRGGSAAGNGGGGYRGGEGRGGEGRGGESRGGGRPVGRADGRTGGSSERPNRAEGGSNDAGADANKSSAPWWKRNR